MPRPFSERERDLVRQRLLQAGREAFASFGLRRTAVDDLARAAGISKGAFYLFFDSKEGLLLEILERHHFVCYKPYGAYYIMTDISTFGFADDVEFARYLVKSVGVAAVPGSSFYKTGAGKTKLRFCFCKKDETLAEADRRLLKLVPANVTLH